MSRTKPTRREFLLDARSRQLAQDILDAGIGEAEDGVYPLGDFDHNGRHKSETDPSFPPPDPDEDLDSPRFDGDLDPSRSTSNDC